jgi:ABC-type multidrug transport system ATPase subunit
MNPSIDIRGLKKKYNDIIALNGVTVSVAKGEIFGYIGPDGAGKTTLFRILTTLLIPDEGDAFVEGFHTVRDFKKIRKIVGYMPGRFSLYQDLSVEENLKFFASSFGTTIHENYHLIKDIYAQIEPFKKRPAGKLSGGMKQKLALSCALIHKPEVLFLDEPTTGVDAVSRKEFWDMLKKLKDEGITIMVSTPYMDEASQCDRVSLVLQGRILETDTPSGIIRNYRWPLLAVRSDNMFDLPDDLSGYDQAMKAYRFGEVIHLVLKNKEGNMEPLKEYLNSKGHTGIVVQHATPSIEDCFMDLMQA